MMAYTGVVVGGGGGDGLIKVLNTTIAILDTLRCPQIVVLNIDGTGKHFSVGEDGVVTRIMRTCTTGWALCAMATNPAGFMAHGAEFDVDGVLGVYVQLPKEFEVMVSMRMIQIMDWMESVWGACPD